MARLGDTRTRPAGGGFYNLWRPCAGAPTGQASSTPSPARQACTCQKPRRKPGGSHRDATRVASHPAEPSACRSSADGGLSEQVGPCLRLTRPQRPHRSGWQCVRVARRARRLQSGASSACAARGSPQAGGASRGMPAPVRRRSKRSWDGRCARGPASRASSPAGRALNPAVCPPAPRQRTGLAPAGPLMPPHR